MGIRFGWWIDEIWCDRCSSYICCIEWLDGEVFWYLYWGIGE